MSEQTKEKKETKCDDLIDALLKKHGISPEAVLEEKRTNRSSYFLYFALISCWRSCGSGMFVCWEKVGEAKLIASTARAINRRVSLLPPRWM